MPIRHEHEVGIVSRFWMHRPTQGRSNMARSDLRWPAGSLRRSSHARAGEKNLSQNTRLERLWYGDANACPAGMRPCSDLAWTGRSGSGLLDGPDLPIKTPT